MKKLLPEQRDFFSQIAALAFVNPFGEQRELADCKLLGIAPGAMGIYQRSDKIQIRLHAQFQELQTLAEYRINAYQGKAHEIVKFSWLFYQFHEFQTQFNQFIEEQRLAGDTPLELHFAKDLHHRFQLAGFTAVETETVQVSLVSDSTIVAEATITVIEPDTWTAIRVWNSHQ